MENTENLLPGRRLAAQAPPRAPLFIPLCPPLNAQAFTGSHRLRASLLHSPSSSTLALLLVPCKTAETTWAQPNGSDGIQF